MRVWRQGLGAIVASLALLGCGGLSPVDPEAGGTRTVDGTVLWRSFEGGFYAIRGADNALYDPTALPSGFQHDQLKVRATLRIRRDLVSFHMSGQVVDVLALERR